PRDLHPFPTRRSSDLLEEPYYPNSFGDVFRWQVTDRIGGRRREAPGRVRVPQVEPDLALIRSGAPSLTWVGHATWLVRLGGRSIDRKSTRLNSSHVAI